MSINNTEKKVKTVGICVARIQEEYEYKIVMSIVRELKKRGCRSLVFNAFIDMYSRNEYAEGESMIYKLIRTRHVDSLIVLSEAIKNDTVSEEIIDFAKANDLPVFTIERPLAGCPSIQFDYGNAFEEIVRHVVEFHGCKTVNIIAGQKGNAFSEERLAAYRKVLEENGIAYDQTRVGYGDFWTYPTIEVMKRFLADERGLPDAIVCCNDTMALTACQMLQESGYSIPDDIIVSGFDGIETEQYASPRLLTAATDFETIGNRAADTIIAMMNQEAVPEVATVSFKVRVAQSCGCTSVASHDAFFKITALCEKMSRTRGHEAFMFTYLYDSLECKSYREIAKTAAKHAENMNIWICLNYDYFRDGDNVQKYNDVYGERMVLFCHVKNTELEAFCEEYNLDDYLPDFDRAIEENDVLIISPIHYQTFVYGYSVAGISLDNNDLEYVHRYLNNTNQILENVRKTRQLNAAYAEMQNMYIRDSLTGLFNRRGFEKKCEELIERDGEEKQFILLSVDLDNLKYINDHFGHDKGDVAIIAAANILNQYSIENSVCARFGGDEYIMVMAVDVATKQERLIMDYIEEKIRAFNEQENEPFELIMSTGFAIVEEATMEKVHESMKLADERMYEQKRQHKRERNQKN